MKLNELDILGHSLGAHLAGYVGKRFIDENKVPLIRRITGLDPAGGYFENMEPVTRLQPTDATFVDVIHTNAVDPPIQINSLLLIGDIYIQGI